MKRTGFLRLRILRLFKTKVHFLHVCKTGGAAIRSVLMEHRETPKYRLKLHNHDFSLEMVRPGEKAIFFLRDPVTRFSSAFYSRLRQGRPRYLYEWNEIEERLFAAFQTPNAMAQALADVTSPNHELVKKALRELEPARTEAASVCLVASPCVEHK